MSDTQAPAEAPPEPPSEAAPVMMLDGRAVPVPPEVFAALPRAGGDPVPQSVTRFQARAVMRRQVLGDGRTLLQAIEADLLAGVEAVAALPPTDPRRLAAEDAAEAWREAISFERSSGLIVGLAAGYGLADADVDALFRAASVVTA